MNKYPAPAPQQYSDYEDDDGPGLGTLGAALAAGALLTPVGRPVRALAKKGLGAADGVLGGAGGRGVDRVKAAGIAAGDAMFPKGSSTREMVDNIRTELAKTRGAQLNARKAARADFSPEDFALDALAHNAGRTWEGIKTPTTGLFKHLFANRQHDLPLNVDPAQTFEDIVGKSFKAGLAPDTVYKPGGPDVVGAPSSVGFGKGEPISLKAKQDKIGRRSDATGRSNLAYFDAVDNPPNLYSPPTLDDRKALIGLETKLGNQKIAPAATDAPARAARNERKKPLLAENLAAEHKASFTDEAMKADQVLINKMVLNGHPPEFIKAAYAEHIATGKPLDEAAERLIKKNKGREWLRSGVVLDG